MAINQLESNLEAITRTIAKLKKDGCTDEKILNELRSEREKILKDLKCIPCYRIFSNIRKIFPR